MKALENSDFILCIALKTFVEKNVMTNQYVGFDFLMFATGEVERIMGDGLIKSGLKEIGLKRSRASLFCLGRWM